MNLKPILKRTVIVLVIFLALIQFVPVTLNQSPHIYTTELYRVYPVPADVQVALQRACYDCHSGQSTYPWYSHIQPVGWWINEHIHDGKRHLDFYQFNLYNSGKKIKKLKEIAGTVKDWEMPLSSYLLMHDEAKLTTEQREKISSWALALAEQIADTAKL